MKGGKIWTIRPECDLRVGLDYGCNHILQPDVGLMLQRYWLVVICTSLWSILRAVLIGKLNNCKGIHFKEKEIIRWWFYPSELYSQITGKIPLIYGSLIIFETFIWIVINTYLKKYVMTYDIDSVYRPSVISLGYTLENDELKRFNSTET